MSSSRRILAIDSSTELASVCWTDGERWIERREDAGQRHSALIMALVRSVLDEARCAAVDLDEVTFGAGPGSFTGLRIACGIAQGIGYGARIPVRAVSSLMAIAQASGGNAVIAAIDARMNEVYWAAYRRDATGREDADALPGAGQHVERPDTTERGQSVTRWSEVVAPSAAAAAGVALPHGSDWCAAGNAFARFAPLIAKLSPSTPVDASIEVTARALAALALAGHGVLTDAEHAMPIYIRDKVAMTTAERLAVRR